jgi:hypothetical protein
MKDMVCDLRDLEMARWDRMGGKAAFIHLYGMQGITAGYIGEIPRRSIETRAPSL